jgi:hypothetical protein
MSRHKNTKDSICAGCGQEIDETHSFFVHKRGTKDEYEKYHSECLKLVKPKNARKDKKTGKDA